ncbi:glutathione S-transferase family protein [Erythrobacter sp. JK5]|uniref:glutathione S-transferase family protein n=1 Tax=Erythrobacter sp. JK5 TaxID=2829500 RepID=UPI001BAE2570|nr:glutathione S-transferase family protein [Erythrobacter sp. JK5]QUL38257.1 glutathione S-transferase family protein [Erythrobacter sp. JK5]
MTGLRAYHLPGRWGLVSVSPFCLKLDAFLRMTGIEHDSVTAATPFGGPKKKAPWIIYKGRTLGDSALIIVFLTGEFATDVDAHLSAKQRGIAVAIQRLVEENLYWAMVYDRWCRDENWPILKASVLGDIPALPRAILAPLARRGVKKQLAGHGMGLHSDENIAAISSKDIAALGRILGDGPWFFGDAPSLADATVYSLLANIVYVPFASPMKAAIASDPSLTEWLERFRGAVYPQFTPETA